MVAKIWLRSFWDNELTFSIVIWCVLRRSIMSTFNLCEWQPTKQRPASRASALFLELLSSTTITTFLSPFQWTRSAVVPLESSPGHEKKKHCRTVFYSILAVAVKAEKNNSKFCTHSAPSIKNNSKLVGKLCSYFGFKNAGQVGHMRSECVIAYIVVFCMKGHDGINDERERLKSQNNAFKLVVSAIVLRK